MRELASCSTPAAARRVVGLVPSGWSLGFVLASLCVSNAPFLCKGTRSQANHCLFPHTMKSVHHSRKTEEPVRVTITIQENLLSRKGDKVDAAIKQESRVLRKGSATQPPTPHPQSPGNCFPSPWATHGLSCSPPFRPCPPPPEDIFLGSFSLCSHSTQFHPTFPTFPTEAADPAPP